MMSLERCCGVFGVSEQAVDTSEQGLAAQYVFVLWTGDWYCYMCWAVHIQVLFLLVTSDEKSVGSDGF